MPTDECLQNRCDVTNKVKLNPYGITESFCLIDLGLSQK